jgi:hypothetical protein
MAWQQIAAAVLYLAGCCLLVGWLLTRKDKP